MTNDPTVRILLATFNGARYLPQQFESIASQTFTEWELVVSDDGSTDGTLALIKDFAARSPGKVQCTGEGGRHGGPRENFSYLLSDWGHGDYLFFCDQDDVWLARKLEMQLAEMRRLEAIHGSDTPLLIHSDLELVAADGSHLHPSMSRSQNLQPATRHELRHLLVQNNVTGCTVLINRALRDRALPIPEQAIMHDWWLALVAAAFGRISYLDVPLVRYRQHGSNSVGAKPYSLGNMARSAGRLDLLRQGLRLTFEQAAAFERRYAGELSPAAHGAVSAYAHLEEMNALERRRTLARHGFWKAGAARNLGLLLLL